MAQRPVCGNLVEWEWGGASRHSGLGSGTGQDSWSPMVLSGGSAQELGAEVPTTEAQPGSQPRQGWAGVSEHSGVRAPGASGLYGARPGPSSAAGFRCAWPWLQEHAWPLSADGPRAGAEAEGRLQTTQKQNSGLFSPAHSSDAWTQEGAEGLKLLATDRSRHGRDRGLWPTCQGPAALFWKKQEKEGLADSKGLCKARGHLLESFISPVP